MSKFFLILVFFNLFLLSAQAKSSELPCNTLDIDKFLSAKYARFIDINIPNSKKWNKNYFKALKDDFSGRNTILQKYKKKFNANINVLFDNDLKCNFSAKVRISGDNKDHLYNKNNHQYDKSPITSLDVKLLNGNINSITKFKLFIPSTREGDNEVFSTALLRELGFLAPKTYYVDSKFNGQKTVFIFQEKITKEFLESNNLREAPILEGDERFLFSNDLKGFNRFGLARVSNKKWANKGETSLRISKIALNLLNTAYLEFLSGAHIHNNPNSALILTKPFSDSNIDRDRIFRSILTATSSRHALLPHNRRFYYDPMYRRMDPIYYDGDSLIIKLKKISNIISDLNNSEIIGSEGAIKLLIGINRENFKNKLDALGLDYSLQEIELILDNVLSNLKIMNRAIITEDLNKEYNPYFSEYIDSNEDTKSKRLVFFTEDALRIEICDFSLSSCSFSYLNIDNYSKLLSGRYTGHSNVEYIFIGNKDEYISGLREQNFTNISEVYVENDTHLIGYGHPKILINKKEKQIKIYQNSIDDRVLIKGGSLKKWSIVFNGYTGNNVINNKQRFNNNLITGCLTLLDMHVDNVSIDINGSQCEDGVNMIRVTGMVDTIKVNNAVSDAIDADSSKINFDNIIINNSENDCIDLSYGDYHINNAKLTKCADKAISVGEKSKLLITSSKILNSNTGIVAKDSSVVEVVDIISHKVSLCFSAYNKKQEFWGGKIIINNHNCDPNQIYQKKGSLIKFMK